MAAQSLREVRRAVAEKSDQYTFDQCELDLIQSNDWYVGIFLEDNKNDLDNTVNAILKALVYRQKYETYKMKAQHLPMELYAWNIRAGSDISGKKVVWINYGCHKNAPELVDSMVRVLYWYALSRYGKTQERHDSYADLRGLSFKSIDMRLSRKVSSMMTTCFPGMVDHLYICGLPWTLTAIIQTMVNMLPSRHSSNIHFITIDQAKARVARLTPIARPEGSNIRNVLLEDNVPEARIDQIEDTLKCARAASEKQFDQLGLDERPMQS
ncbi:hypothetical protein HDE_00558 [Halotydeus destructor]|nr:hypothetical protein HDE_00558 [Halotydeus destructor]